jgi:hypothetical protein
LGEIELSEQFLQDVFLAFVFVFADDEIQYLLAHKGYFQVVSVGLFHVMREFTEEEVHELMFFHKSGHLSKEQFGFITFQQEIYDVVNRVLSLLQGGLWLVHIRS